MSELMQQTVVKLTDAVGFTHGYAASIHDRLPHALRPLFLNPLNLSLLALLLYLLLPLLKPSFLFEPTTSAHFLKEYPTMAQAKLHGLPGTGTTQATKRRWRNYLRRLKNAAAGSAANGSLPAATSDELALEATRRRAGLTSRLSAASAGSAYSFLPSYHPPSIKWTVYTPRTLALHDGSGIALSDRDVHATYDERRDGANAKAAAERRLAEQRRVKGDIAFGAAGAAGQSHEQSRGSNDVEEEEEDIGGYAFAEDDRGKDKNSEHTSSSANDPSTRILLAIGREVYDVTAGKNFYGPGGPYAIFAGRDASIGMAKQSFEPDMLTPLDQPIASLDGLSNMERTNMVEWMNHFKGKYGIVGRLVNEGEEDHQEAQS